MGVAARVSPIEAASRAIAQTRRNLFPFRFERWLALGLVTFLDQCGRTGGGGGGNYSFGGKNNDAGEMIRRGASWIGEHTTLFAGLTLGVLILIVALTALALWLNSRGTFMYIDNVATGRSDIVRPWTEHRGHANSYFAWKFGIALGTLAIVIMMLVPFFLILVNIAQKGARPASIAGVVIMALAMIGMAIVAALVSLAMRDFVAPIQLQRCVSCGVALRLFMTQLRAHLGPLLVYLLLKIAYVLALGIGIVTVVCVTCCTTLCCLAIPVVAQTILLPFFYFERAWSLQLLHDMGFDVTQSFGREGAAVA